jgi:hypothetical protein
MQEGLRSSAKALLTLIRFVLCVFLASAPAGAGPFEDGISAYDQQHFTAALGLWLPLAEQGYPAAQFNVGVLYEKGLGVTQDPAEAARWYLKAAERGDTDAQYKMATLYETGGGVAKNVREARRWYSIVATNTSLDAATVELKQRAQARLASLPSVTQEVVSYAGGRFVIARSLDGVCVVALQGNITKSAASQFDDVVRKAEGLGCTNPSLLLESPGGLLFEALDLGIKIRRSGFRTISRSVCASACAMIFLGGSERTLVGSGARIGLHQPSIDRGRSRTCDTTTYTSAAREMSDYLKSVIPEKADQVVELVRQTPCDKIEWIYGQRALALGIATRLEEAH